MPRDALGLPPGVDEYQRSAVPANELRQAVVDLRPHLPRHHRLERGGGDLELQVALADVSRVDDGAVGRAVGEEIARADEESGHFLDRLLRSREADAREPATGEEIGRASCRERG